MHYETRGNYTIHLRLAGLHNMSSAEPITIHHTNAILQVQVLNGCLSSNLLLHEG